MGVKIVRLWSCRDGHFSMTIAGKLTSTEAYFNSSGASTMTGSAAPTSLTEPCPDGDRWQLVGSAAGVVTLFVAYADPVTMADGSELGRIISVRKASSHERKAYEGGNF
jgi:uncharacterized DUF497 family protein